MKNINKKLILLTMLMTLGFACSDDFFDKKPVDQGSVDNFFQTEEDLLAATNAIYDVFQGSIWGGAFYIMPMHFDVVTDNAVGCCNWEYEYTTIAKGQQNATTGGVITNKWIFGYEGIFRANSVLENIDNVDISDSDRTALTAEVRFLRALFMTEMVTLFGDIPLVTKVLTREEALVVTRTPKSEVLDQIYQDLDFAEQNLGTSPFAGHTGRPTMMSAIAVKTRLKLYNLDWSGAAAEAKKLIDLSASNPDLIGLVDDYESVFSSESENLKEVLFDIQFVEGTAGEGNALQVMIAPGPEGNPGSGWGSITPLDGLVDSYYMIDGLPTDQSPLFDPANPYLNRDPRMLINLFVPGISEWKGGIYNENLGGFSPYFAVRKWVDLDAEIGQDGCNCNETNFILYRYGDVVMMYAEAENEVSGPSANVYDAINSIRVRAGMPVVTPGLDQDQMRDVIRHERQVEFAWEGTRYFDLVRWGTASTVIPQATLFGQSMDSRVFESYMNLFPIPQSEIDQNPNLLQNPGY